MSLATFLSIAAIHLLAAISPGPSFVLSARISASEGFRTGAALAFGFGIGAAIWAAAALLGLAVLFEVLPQLFLVLKLAGAAFLIWIAISMWRHADAPIDRPDPDAPPRGIAAAVRLGLATFLANPKPAVFFGAVFVGLVPADAGPLALCALLAVIFVNETLWYVLVARLLSTGRARAAYTRAKATIDRLFGGLIAMFGLRIAIG
ncbi:LysE family translocator [Mesobaculum littorinae]|uniref:LysE family translocator n=1 Tax=Mesobaculum littorinae TaxID=2486419 RepID=A0A438AJI7_9RHOB|nr:LysE family translocator [Mesobaculum littorinae]RVV98838.1 LysE family translocator [Mesobaculum littorinae]